MKAKSAAKQSSGGSDVTLWVVGVALAIALIVLSAALRGPGAQPDYATVGKSAPATSTAP
jgi:hypothetical protein